jgi:hypothetical protein
MENFCEPKPPLGELLQTAALISDSQIKVALYDRNYYQDLRLGEILALRGWIAQETADFFADRWWEIKVQSEKYPLGYYLNQAALLSESEIANILEEQPRLWLKFGSIAVLKGSISEATLDFFLKNLYPSETKQAAFIGKKTQTNSSEVTATESSKTIIDYEDIPWID